jgi:hypothetical protein
MPSSTQSSGLPASRSTVARRLAGVMVLSAILFLVLWTVVFTAVTSAIVAGGVGGILVVGSAASDVFEMVVDAICNLVLGILAAIGAFFAGLFALFGN